MHRWTRKYADEVRAVLDSGGWYGGRYVRRMMNRKRSCWSNWDRVSFYFLMDFLEEDGVIEHKVEVSAFAGNVRVWFYRLKESARVPDR